ncbi:protein transport protein Sec24A [Tribolium madens]|uniref:protein transport protein Sec24A n=1 Tax=Tribolium madens TaxID=41895 RepID=UPI001CF73F1D|nr:protein transport protein Sec24A [Tribolium madens]XP_044255775.1 protein transport protein Sec24A [Tribolium madens]
MAQPNQQNGMPPQMKPPIYNGVHSSHSSRDSSPHGKNIPISQLPPRSAIPPTQLPPSRSPNISQQMNQLNINKFNTSTPNQSPKPSGVVNSAFSTIGSTQAPPRTTQAPPTGYNFNQKPPSSSQGFAPPTAQTQGHVPTQGYQTPPTQGQMPVINKQGHQQPVPQTQMPPFSNQGRQNPPTIQNQGQAPLPTQSKIPPPIKNQSFVPPPHNFNSSPINQGVAPPLTQGQNQVQAPSSQNFNSIPPNQGLQPPPTQGQIPPPNSQIPQYNNFNSSPSNQGYRPPPAQAQMPPPLKSQAYQPSPTENNLPSNQFNNSSPRPPPGQPKANLHSNRYPQAPPSQQNYVPQAQPSFNPPSQNYPVSSQTQQQFYQQNSVTNSGFNKLWGHDHFDLLQNPNVLPPEKVAPPKVYLGNELLDSANCSPDVFRCTMTKIPESNSLLQKSRLPLGILIHPFKDLTHLPVIQCNVIVRCRACRTYINPFVYFIDTKRWKCNLCYRVNELPEEFQFDPVSKTYGDPTRRPEIKSSTIEYIAPAEYMLRPPQPAVYLFLFDISRLAIESGYLQSACAVLLEELKNLPGDARTQVGILAYDSALHFFGLGEGLSQPHEMTVLEIDDIFLPCPDNLLVNLKDRIDLLTDLLTQLPTRYNNSYDNNSALGAALQAAHKMMGATGGRVSVFQASLPNVGPGALIPREDPSQRASTEVQHLNPANDFYKRLALECSGQQIAVDLFVLNSQYVDMATISGISRFSGGCIYHFPLFKASRVLQNERFERSFRRYLIRKIGFEAVMRIRCTRGLSIHTFHGNFFVRSTDLLSLPNVSPDAAFGMQVSIDESLSDVQSVCFQAALLYTSSKGERRIRVHTLCLPVCATLSDVINAADQQCIVGLLAKMAVDRSMQSSLSDAREAFINVAIDILSSYKFSLNMAEGATSLLAPHCLRLLPLYISALLKSTAFRTGTCTRLDDRVKAMIDMKTKPLGQLIQMIYPDLYPVHNLDEQPVVLNSEEEPIPQPPHMQLTARCLDSKGAFLMDTGEHMILLVAPGVSSVFLNEALGVRDYVSITDEMYELPVLDNLHNQRLHQFIHFLNDEKPAAATLHVIRDNSPNRIEFYEKLIEDRVENALSYHEFMQHLKTQVK